MSPSKQVMQLGELLVQVKRLESEKQQLAKVNEALRAELVAETARVRLPERRRLPDERKSLTHRFEIFATRDEKPVTYKGYLTMGFYDATPASPTVPLVTPGALGEVFFKIDRAGSEVSGLCDAWAIGASMLLQYGVPFDVIAAKHRGAKFEPSGFTSNKDPSLRSCTSPIDYVVRYIEHYLAARAAIPCIHGRPGGYLCPHCLDEQRANASGATTVVE